MKPSTVISLLLALLLATLYFSGSIAEFLTDWRWFAAVGFGDVFTTAVKARVGMGGVVGLIAFAILQGNAAIALRATSGRSLQLSQELSASPLGALLRRSSPIRVATVASALLGGLIGLGTSSFWQEFLLYLHGPDFGWVEPILGHDAGFYIFTLPLLQILRGSLLAVTVVSAVASVVIYGMRGAIRLDLVEVRGQITAQGLEVQPAARRHLAVLAGFWLVVIAAGTLLGRYALLYGQEGLISGPSKAQVSLAMPLMLAQAVITVAAAAAVAWGIQSGKARYWVSGIVAVVAASIVTSLVPDVYQRLAVLPNELAVEEPFIQHHVKATRYAYDLDDIGERKLSGEAKLTWQDIEDNHATVQNIRLWDHGPLLDTFSQVQEIRTYYNFPGVDNDRYLVDGELRQTMLSPRELQPSSLPARARTWVNESMVYTHGYGVTLGPVNEVTQEGLPYLWIQDLPPVVKYPDDLRIDQPAIYYGESMRNPVFVKTGNDEFDYPSGEQNAYTDYSGKGGAEVGNLFWRALWSLRLQSSKILLTGDIRPESRVLLYRDVAERVSRIAPFLTLDRDPYMVIADGRLVWILDAYTQSSRFPYSQRVAGLSYMRNSVKVTVDAYDGTVILYRMDVTDPIIDAWASAFPGLLTPLAEMPPAVRAHVRYPLDYFAVQAHLFATYHMTDSQMFYNREDEWEVPVLGGSAMAPYYTIMNVPGEETEEFILMLPFVPRNKPNLAAWIVARSDGDKYGQMLAYRFPKDKMAYGPNMIVARFNQDDEISEKLSLWNQQGSQVHLGTLLVIPIEESLIYVQPLYLSAESGSIPELKRVLVGYENQIAMELTLEDALKVLFGRSSVTSEPPEPAAAQPGDPAGEPSAEPQPASDLSPASAAQVHYQRLSDAAARGDWTTFGQELDALGKALEEVVPPAEPAPPAPEPGTAEEQPTP